MSNKRKLLIKIGVAFIVILIICTFLSRTIKNIMVPKVEITSAENGNLRRNFNTIGTVNYGENDVIKSQADWKIDKVYVRPSQNVDEGTVLAQVNMEKIKQAQEEKDLEIMNSQYDLNSAKASGDKDQIKIKEKEVELLKKEKESLMDGLNQNGEIVAPITGRVTTVYCEDNTETVQGDSLFVVSDNRNTYDISFKSSVEQAAYMHNGIMLTVYYNAAQSVETVKSKIVSKQYNTKEGDYDYVVRLEKSALNGENLDLGEQVSISYECKGDIATCIIPKECIVNDGSGNNSLYILKSRDGLFGKEYFVQKQTVNILGSDDRDYSIKDIGKDKEKIVLKSSKSLSNNTVVKLR